MIIATINTASQEYCPQRELKENEVEMLEGRPLEGNWLAQADGTWLEDLFTEAYAYVIEQLAWCDLQEKLIIQGSTRATEGLTLEGLYAYAEALRDYTTSTGEVVGSKPVIDSYIDAEEVI